PIQERADRFASRREFRTGSGKPTENALSGDGIARSVRKHSGFLKRARGAEPCDLVGFRTDRGLQREELTRGSSGPASEVCARVAKADGGGRGHGAIRVELIGHPATAVAQEVPETGGFVGGKPEVVRRGWCHPGEDDTYAIRTTQPVESIDHP